MTSIWLRLASLYAAGGALSATAAGLCAVRRWLGFRSPAARVFRDEVKDLLLGSWVLFGMCALMAAAWWVGQAWR